MTKQTIFKIFCIATILLLLTLIIEKQNPVTNIPIDYIINDNTEKSSESLNESKEVTVFVADFNDIIFPISLDVKGTKAEFKDEIELTFSMLTEYSNYLPMGVKTVIPPSTRLIDYKINDGTLILTVSSEFLNYNQSDLEVMKDILTYTFTDISTIDSVTILCEEGSTQTFHSLNRRNRIINTIYTADHISNSRTITVFYYANASDIFYLVPVNMIVNKDEKSEEELVNEILTSYYINIPVTSYINEENIIPVNEQFSNVKLGYTNIEDDDLSLKQYFYSIIANTESSVTGNELGNYNEYSIELR